MDRRKVLAGMGGMAAGMVGPAWAQFPGAIKPQNDPYAQVDPYADPRNGFPSGNAPTERRAAPPADNPAFASSARATRHFTPDEDRQELGRAMKSFAPCQADDGGPVPNAQIQEAMNAFIRPIAAVVDRKQFPWRASVARSAAINAWTVGGGQMSFNAGLIAMCDHPGELAAVVAHEAGHVDLGHIIKGDTLMQTLMAAAEQNPALLKDVRGAVGGGIIPDGDGPIPVFAVLKAGFSRTDEFEADEHSLYVLSRAGIQPKWAISMMMKLDEYGYRNGHHLLNGVMIDHPPASERIAELRAKIVNVPLPQGDLVPPGWSVLKAAFPTPAEFRKG